MNISASSAQEFLDCQRKWAFRKLAGMEKPPGPGAATGTLVHAQFEAYLKGEAIDQTTIHGQIAAAGTPYLPHPPPSR